MFRTTSQVFPIVVLLTAGGLPNAAADDPVGSKLDRAKWSHLQALDAAQWEIRDWFDRRERGARKHGNKNLVDQIKQEREIYQARGELPPSASPSLKRKQPDARAALRAALLDAIKEYTRSGDDREAALIERELAEFDASNVTRSRWVHSGGEFRHIGHALWAERAADGKVYQFREVARTADFIELDALNGNTATRVRLRDSSADYGYKPALEFQAVFSGAWAR